MENTIVYLIVVDLVNSLKTPELKTGDVENVPDEVFMEEAYRQHAEHGIKSVMTLQEFQAAFNELPGGGTPNPNTDYIKIITKNK